MAPKRLPNAVDPPAVLRPQDLVERSSNFTPRHGFGERKDRAQLDGAGHRMINHHSRNPGAYAGELIFDRELALPVLYVCFCLLPFFNLQAQIVNIFNFMIGIFWKIFLYVSHLDVTLMPHDGRWR